MKPKKPLTPLHGPARLRVCHLMALFCASHATIYRWMGEGKLPPPDGRMGRHPYWLNETILPHFTKMSTDP